MVCLGFKPGAAGWKAQTNPLSYSDTPLLKTFTLFTIFKKEFNIEFYDFAASAKKFILTDLFTFII